MPIIRANGHNYYIRDFSEPLKNTTAPTSFASTVSFTSAAFNEDLYSDQLSLDIYQKMMIQRWRTMSRNSYIKIALKYISTEMCSIDDMDSTPVELNLTNTTFSKNIQEKIHEEFDRVMKMLRFKKNAPRMIQQWLIDGISYFYLDRVKSDEINSITMLDPLRVAEYNYSKNPLNMTEDPEKRYQYYDSYSLQNAILDLDASNFVQVNSGFMDERNKIWVSILEEAFVNLNQLSALENALIIYRLARAPDRRIFYVDVGELSKSKAEAYIKGLIQNYKNDMQLDPETGNVVEKGKQISLTDDIWLPRSNGKGTEVSTLPGLSNLGEITDIEYFKNKLFRSLNVPYSRFENPTGAWVSRSPEITRDEVLYSKFLSRLRTQYNELFYLLLRTVLDSKKIVDSEEMNENYLDIDFIWSSDNIFNELRNIDIIGERLNAVERTNNYVGKYYSTKWIRRNILKQTDEEIREIDKEIEEEKEMIKDWSEAPAPFEPGIFEPLPGSEDGVGSDSIGGESGESSSSESSSVSVKTTTVGG